MGLIFNIMFNHEFTIEHLILASMTMMSNGQEVEVASVKLIVVSVMHKYH